MKISTTTTSFVKKILMAELRKEGYELASKKVIDYRFLNHERSRIATVQLSTNNGIVRMCLAFGKENVIASKIGSFFDGYFKISLLAIDERPLFNCMVADESSDSEFRMDLQTGYFDGLWMPAIPSLKYCQSEIFMPNNLELAASKALRAVSFAEQVFTMAFPKLDELLPSKAPAPFLGNRTPIGNAIVMLARAIELGIGKKQLVFFNEFMIDTYETIGFHRKTKDAGWRKALPAIEELIGNYSA